jgi:hypothetical protein
VQGAEYPDDATGALREVCMRKHWTHRHKVVHRHQRGDHNAIMWGTIVVVLVVTGLLLWHYHTV